MRIVVLDGYTLNPSDNPWTQVEALGELVCYDRTANEQIIERAKDADIVLTNKVPLTAATLERLPNLKYVSVLATGFNVVDIQEARSRNIPVSNVPVYSTDSVSQLTFALLLELCHHVAIHDAAVKRHEWINAIDFCFRKTPLIELSGKTIGVVGFGKIGRRVGQIANAFGMNVIAYSRSQGPSPEYTPFEWVQLPELFKKADVVSLHCPLTDANAGFVNQNLIEQMKPEAMLINTARGGLIHERDLAEALNSGRIAGAAVDVLSTEPPAETNPLLTAKNCLITPHIAWGTLAARRRLMQITAENIAAFINGTPVNVVN